MSRINVGTMYTIIILSILLIGGCIAILTACAPIQTVQPSTQQVQISDVVKIPVLVGSTETFNVYRINDPFTANCYVLTDHKDNPIFISCK